MLAKACPFFVLPMCRIDTEANADGCGLKCDLLDSRQPLLKAI